MMPRRAAQNLIKCLARRYSETKHDIKPRPVLAMSRPDLYNSSNILQRQCTLENFKLYDNKIKWVKNGDTAIDLGCGDGSVSVMVKNAAPCQFNKFVATDVSESMVQFASERYRDKGISFRVLDIGEDIPNHFVESFNHVFSFYALHWVKDQEKAFKNIYNLLTSEGDCFMTWLATTALYDVYSVLAQHPRWEGWLRDVDVFISPYHNLPKPENIVSEIMNRVGFKNVEVQCKQLTSLQSSLQDLKDIVQAVEPFNMPEEVFNELFEDFKKTGQEIGVIHVDKTDDIVTSVTYNYSLLVCYARK